MDEDNLDMIFKTYSSNELSQILQRVSATIMTMATSNNTELLRYVAIFKKTVAPPPATVIADLFINYPIPTKRTSNSPPSSPVQNLLFTTAGSIKVPAPSISKNCSKLTARPVCLLDPGLMDLHKKLEIIKPFWLNTRPTGPEYVKFRSWALKQLYTTSFYFNAFELIEENYLILVIDAYITLTGDLSFTFVPEWDTMLDALYWPLDDVATILSDLSLILMKPVPLIFSKVTWDNYNLYYEQFKLFLLKNKDYLVQADTRRVNRIFITNLTLDDSILHLVIKDYATMAESLLDINKYLDHEMLHLQYHRSVPSIVTNLVKAPSAVVKPIV